MHVELLLLDLSKKSHPIDDLKNNVMNFLYIFHYITMNN